MIGIPKEVVLNDLNEILSKSFQETGDFNVENYCFYLCPTLYRTLKIWLLDGNINAVLTKFKGVEISLIKNTQYFYLKYSGYPFNPNYPKFPEIEPIINIVGVNLGYRIKRIEKIFEPTETIKKYIQAD